MRTLLHRACAWCRTWLSTEYVAWNGEPESTSHGVCDACLLAHFGTDVEGGS